jgi:hypothetical protein
MKGTVWHDENDGLCSMLRLVIFCLTLFYHFIMLFCMLLPKDRVLQ